MNSVMQGENVPPTPTDVTEAARWQTDRASETVDHLTLLAIYETAGTWVCYPPIGQRGVRLSREDAVRVAEAILASSR